MESNVLELPVLSFKGNNFKVKEITIGTLLDIESMKSTLTNGFYGDILSHKTVLSNWNLDNVDMFATLMVLVPDLIKTGLVATNWRDMTPEDAAELREEYNLKFIPWFEKRISFLNPKKSEEGNG